MKNNFIKCFSVLIFLTISSCSKEEPEEIINNKFEVSVNGSAVLSNKDNLSNQGPLSINTSCTSIFVNFFSYQNITTMHLTKEGVFKSIEYQTYGSANSSGKTYKAAAFKPISTFQIKNFRFNEITKSVYFEFDGYLMNSRKNSDTVQLKGKIDCINIKDAGCGVDWFLEMGATINGYSYKENVNYSKIVNDAKSDLLSFSEDGFSFELSSPEKFDNLPLQTYQFNENTVSNKITFDKYIGIIRADNYITVGPKLPQEWQKYKCIGSFTLTERNKINSSVQTKGIFSMNVYDIFTNELVYTISNGKFQV